MRKLIISILMILLMLFIVLEVIIDEPHTTQEIEKHFKKNEDVILQIKEYLDEQSDDLIIIYSTDFMPERNNRKNKNYGKMTVFNEGAAKAITMDTEIIDAVDRLFKRERNYQRIFKEGKIFGVTMWASMSGSGGIVYVPWNNVKMEELYEVLSYLISIEPLNNEHWYHFETDYNSWREKGTNVTNGV